MSFSAAGFLLGVLPLFALLALLLQDRYPGERTITLLQHFIRDLTAKAVGQVSSGSLASRSRRVRGGRLIACSLAGRSPPSTGWTQLETA